MSSGEGYQPDEVSYGRGRMPRWLAVVIALLLVAVVVDVAVSAIGPGSVQHQATAALDAKHGTICENLRVPVLVEPGTGDRFTVTRADRTVITGRLCTPISARGIKGWQVLIPGFTYGAYYFDFPLRGYSYVKAANAAGWATLDLNRPGTVPGGPYPPAADLTASSEARAIAQVIWKVEPQFVGFGHGRPVIVSHSFGSAVAAELAAQYPGLPRALVLSGWMNNDNPQGRAAAAQQGELASADPMLQGRPAGYLTTKPGGRWLAFYNPADAWHAVADLDDQMRTTGTAAELASITPSESPAIAAMVRAPVLFAMGQRDDLNCSVTDPALSCVTPAAIVARERHLYQVPVSAVVIPGAGHDVLLARNGAQWTRAVLAWAGGLK